MSRPSRLLLPTAPPAFTGRPRDVLKLTAPELALRERARAEARRKVAAGQRAYYERNREKVAAGKRAWRERNREKVAAGQRAWRERNRDKIAAGQRAYYERNRDKWRTVYSVNRRRKLQQLAR